ncbi:MAG: tRNA (adenosine(37)-N6)-threonylcarbamoyltransferase complex dimerization subunit type 1 TsaB [Candidatus Dasytiphilus stammeri]
MRILAIDTSTDVCSVALFNNGEITSVLKYCPKNHAQSILPMIQKLISEAGICLNQLEVLAYNRGPGSFTGLRIGMGIVQGIGLALDLPLIGISSLAIVAEGAWHLTGIPRVLVALDAYMGEIYWGEYQRTNASYSSWNGIKTETVLKPLAVESKISNLNGIWCLAGNGWHTYQELKDIKRLYISSPISIPIAKNILSLARAAFKEGKIFSAECSIEPYYMRNDLSWQPKENKMKIFPDPEKDA